MVRLLRVASNLGHKALLVMILVGTGLSGSRITFLTDREITDLPISHLLSQPTDTSGSALALFFSSDEPRAIQSTSVHFFFYITQPAYGKILESRLLSLS